MRSLGEFFGHIASGIRADPTKPAPQQQQQEPQRREVSRTVEEQQRDTPQGKLTLRRTVIEEVELPQPQPPDA